MAFPFSWSLGCRLRHILSYFTDFNTTGYPASRLIAFAPPEQLHSLKKEVGGELPTYQNIFSPESKTSRIDYAGGAVLDGHCDQWQECN
jgi:hypothetical protein